MRLPGRKALTTAARWLRSRLGRSALILGYHRVADTQDDVYGMCVSPHHFEEQMQVIRTNCNPLSLEELVDSLREADIPERAVAVTFDDGYVDFLEAAFPILEHWDIRATVFIVAGLLGQEFWWDELYRRSRSLQQSEIAALFNSPMMAARGMARNEGYESQSDLPNRLLSAIYNHARLLTMEQRIAFFGMIRDATGGRAIPNTMVRAMTADQVHQISSSDLVSIGSHSMTHPELPLLEHKARQHEIRQSKHSLEELIHGQVEAFSYPFGSHDRSTASIIHEAGYQAACSSSYDTVRAGSRRFALPRFWVQDWDGDHFSRWIRRWLRG